MHIQGFVIRIVRPAADVMDFLKSVNAGTWTTPSSSGRRRGCGDLSSVRSMLKVGASPGLRLPGWIERACLA